MECKYKPALLEANSQAQTIDFEVECSELKQHLKAAPRDAKVTVTLSSLDMSFMKNHKSGRTKLEATDVVLANPAASDFVWVSDSAKNVSSLQFKTSLSGTFKAQVAMDYGFLDVKIVLSGNATTEENTDEVEFELTMNSKIDVVTSGGRANYHSTYPLPQSVKSTSMDEKWLPTKAMKAAGEAMKKALSDKVDTGSAGKYIAIAVVVVVAIAGIAVAIYFAYNKYKEGGLGQLTTPLQQQTNV